MASVLLRYQYLDGSYQAALPMRVVSDDGDRVVAWLAPDTEIMYWALPGGGDPRSVPLGVRFTSRLTTAPRRWQGGGVLRVIPIGLPFQVLHFWHEHGGFAGWYVNFEAPKRRNGDRLDSIDWHLDLWISPELVPAWKDADEAEAALAAGHLTPEGHAEGMAAGTRDHSGPGRVAGPDRRLACVRAASGLVAASAPTGLGLLDTRSMRLPEPANRSTTTAPGPRSSRAHNVRHRFPGCTPPEFPQWLLRSGAVV
jgi:hypothetical protein